MSGPSRRNVLIGAFGLAGQAAVIACEGTSTGPFTAESVRRAEALRRGTVQLDLTAHPTPRPAKVPEPPGTANDRPVSRER